VNRAKARGDATPSVQQVLDHMMAPIIYRLIFGAGVEPALAEQLAGEVFMLISPADKTRTPTPRSG
jgi:hypothetical protein